MVTIHLPLGRYAIDIDIQYSYDRCHLCSSTTGLSNEDDTQTDFR